MAKRGRKPQSPLSAMVQRLEQLDTERKALVSGIQAAMSSLLSGRISARRGGTTAAIENVPQPPSLKERKKRAAMSQEARDKIAAAQRRRWAKVRKAADKS